MIINNNEIRGNTLDRFPLFSFRKQLKRIKHIIEKAQYTSPKYEMSKINKKINLSIFTSNILLLFNIIIIGKNFEEYRFYFLLLKENDDFFILKIYSETTESKIEEALYLMELILIQEYKKGRIISIVKIDDTNHFRLINEYLTNYKRKRDKAYEGYLKYTPEYKLDVRVYVKDFNILTINTTY